MSDAIGTAMITFYKPSEPHGYLSNFSQHGIQLEGAFWMTTEHFFQGMKTLVPEERDAIRGASTPGRAKNLGRVCTLRTDWDDVVVMPEKFRLIFSDDRGGLVERKKDHYMYSALVQKFHQHLELQQWLLDTGDAPLVEESPMDAYWGSAFKNGTEGLNKLGRMLMLVRKRIRERALEK